MPDHDQEPARLERARILARGNWRVCRSREGGLIAFVTWALPAGEHVTMTATLPASELATIARLLRQRQQAEGAAAGGWDWGAIARTAQRISRARVMRRLVQSADQVLQDPRVARAMGFAKYIPVYGQAAYAAYRGARAATSLAARAQRGDRSALADAARLAASTNPDAQRAYGMFTEAQRQLSRQGALRAASAGMHAVLGGAVSGALYTPPQYDTGAVRYGGRTMLLRQ